MSSQITPIQIKPTVALTQSTQLSSGATASYWKILSIGVDYLAQTVTVNLGGYIDQPTYATGATPLTTQTLYFSGANFFDPCSGVYAQIQGQSNWTNATASTI